MNHPVAARINRIDLISHIVRLRLAELKRSRNNLPVIVLLVAAISFSHDLYVDIVIEGMELSHILVEGGIFVSVLLVLAIEIRRVVGLYSVMNDSQSEVLRMKRQLTQVIRAEFDGWQLTPTEKEIALLLIKGLSMREIAGIRQVKEKSVRQQSTGIYTKAGVGNRYELAAYFIEDLLIPAAA